MTGKRIFKGGSVVLTVVIVGLIMAGKLAWFPAMLLPMLALLFAFGNEKAAK